MVLQCPLVEARGVFSHTQTRAVDGTARGETA